LSYTDCSSVVHFAGYFDKRAATLLGPVTDALSETGMCQVVISTDDARYGQSNLRLHPSVETILVPIDAHSLRRTWRALTAELTSVLGRRAVYAVHFHGPIACLIGNYVLGSGKRDAHVLYSPSGVEWLDRFQVPAGLLRSFLGSQCALLDAPPVASSLAEARTLSRITGRAADLVEFPVLPAFFQTECRTAKNPLIVTAGNAPREHDVDLYTRLAVLFYAERLPVRFSWIGDVSDRARARLMAAQVRVFETFDAADTARYLAQAWMFVQTQTGHDVGAGAAQAMAMGLPCLVSDTIVHRDIIRHTENGFICTSERDFIDRLTALIADPAERSRIGSAARAEAKRRFTTDQFRRRLLSLYGFAETGVGSVQLERRMS
jgi:glycosyltransferase involved in cell wall biosynthesis